MGWVWGRKVGEEDLYNLLRMGAGRKGSCSMISATELVLRLGTLDLEKQKCVSIFSLLVALNKEQFQGTWMCWSLDRIGGNSNIKLSFDNWLLEAVLLVIWLMRASICMNLVEWKETNVIFFCISYEKHSYY